jgi:hypothetical protein
LWILFTPPTSSEPSVHGTHGPSPSSPATKCSHSVRDGCGEARSGENVVAASGSDLGFEMQLQCYAGCGRDGASEEDEPTRNEKWSSEVTLHGYLYEMV